MQAIIDMLIQLPSEIYGCEIELIEKQTMLNRAKDELAMKESNLLLSGQIDGKNAETREAQLRAGTVEERQRVSEAEIAVLYAKAKLNMAMNKLSAYKAVARILGKEVE